MKLQRQTPNRGPFFQQVRETPKVFQALADEALTVGITQTEALRQIIQSYIDKPFRFSVGQTKGFKSCVWSNITAPQETIDAFTSHTQAQGVSTAEGIRQCVRRYLENQGQGA